MAKLFVAGVDTFDGYMDTVLVQAEDRKEARARILDWNDTKGTEGDDWGLVDLREVRFVDGYWQSEVGD